ncbi:uncharacterized protein N7469_009447 [Penicillium citrinum]|uniref:Uncharacterized protein n=1 Tax=Penicillium citrinum TaxID=5077 RepID=A0A9W9NNE7_PENCI|nr:uncharacterized protein N7469_009447 [Penicillium citrinum]KAJ5223207.1 hypothetical protein N7469_009447 [Penicillium citrinum]
MEDRLRRRRAPPRVHPRRGRRRCARSPGASAPPAPMESVDGWPLATPDTRFLGGSRPVGSAVRRRRPRGPDPPPEGRMPQPASARPGGQAGTPACGPALRGLVGAIGWPPVSSPVRRGRRAGRAPRAPQP